MRLITILKRNMSSRRLIYSEFGDPLGVLKLETYSPEPKQGQMLVKMLAAPVNPADLNTVQGVYPLKPKAFPAVPGGEGVGVVVETGGSKEFHKGDMVILARQVIGTWQSYLAESEENFTKVNKKLDLVAAATLMVNPPTALRMLKDYEDLKPGDTVVQNAGNSAVGIAVIQLCSHFGLKSISVVRNRDNIQQLKSYLEGLGKDSIVLTEEEFRTYKCKCQIAFNAVGGKAVADLARALDNGRTMVTYGAMSKQPVILAASSLIFKNITLKGFWMSRWKMQSTKEACDETFQYLSDLYVAGKLKPPTVQTFSLDKYKEALANTSKSLFVF